MWASAIARGSIRGGTPSRSRSHDVEMKPETRMGMEGRAETGQIFVCARKRDEMVKSLKLRKDQPSSDPDDWLGGA